MSIADVDASLRDQIREIVADILEVEIEDVTWSSSFQDDLGAHSLQGIQILAALERRFGVEIDQSLLPRMTDVAQTYQVLLHALRDK
jgi:acyl carrier protein